MEESLDAFVAGDDGAGEDRQQHRESGEVLDPPVAEGEAPARLATCKQESGGERNGGGRVGEVVDGVGEQLDASGERDHQRLQDSRRHQVGERPFHRPQAPLGAGDGGIDDPVRMSLPVMVCTHRCSPFTRRGLQTARAQR